MVFLTKLLEHSKEEGDTEYPSPIGFLFYLHCQRTEKENSNCYLSILILVEQPPLTFQIGVSLHLLALLKYCWKGSATLLLLIKVLGLRKCHLQPIDWLAGYHFNS